MDREYPRTGRNTSAPRADAQTLEIPADGAPVEPAAHSSDQTKRGTACARVPVGRRRRATGPALQEVGMSREIIRLSIPIGTIAISTVAAFAFSWVGLALLGY